MESEKLIKRGQFFRKLSEIIKELNEIYPEYKNHKIEIKLDKTDINGNRNIEIKAKEKVRL